MVVRNSHRLTKTLKWFTLIIILMISTFVLLGPREKIRIVVMEIEPHNFLPIDAEPIKNWRRFSPAQINSLSNLGKILYLEEEPKILPGNDKYKILIWKYGSALINRHIKHYSNERFDPFEDCSVKNCEITYDDNEVGTADAVLFHMQRINGIADMPKINRTKDQRWIFLTDETPFHTFAHANVKLKDFNGLFNWSMTYRMDSDVPVPYGRTVRRKPTDPRLQKIITKRTDVLIAILGSNCGGRNHRWQYVKELQKHINVDIYGGCGPLKCAGHFNKDCDKLNNYKFYLSFENSNCQEYITEKLWWNAFSKNAIPIVMGASEVQYQQMLPPHSYINVDRFANPSDLARFVLYVNRTKEIYQSFFTWKAQFTVLNEHGYFGSNSVHYCRICEALNYNSRDAKVYDDLQKFWSTKECYPNWEETRSTK